jgi:predicted small lipoprotein YifL
LYGAARFGDIVVIVHLRPTSSGWAVVLLGVVALALAGCGRKGALDLPPNASGPNGPVAAAPVDNGAEAVNKPNLFNANPDVDAAPSAPKGRKKPFVLDPLLDR